MENKNPENVSSPYSKDIEETKKAEQKYNEIIEELLANPKVQELQRNYTPGSFENFIKHYASEKVRILTWGPDYEQWNENEETKWFEECFSCFEEIQQKKLFDLQCQWRADQIKVKGIDICGDFQNWEDNILNCPYIQPIEPQEIDLYGDYLRSGDHERGGWFFGIWQDYEGVKEGYNSDNQEGCFPAWYDFYNVRMGTGTLMLLPDVRGTKEDFYLRLSRKASEVQKEAENIIKPVTLKPQLTQQQSRLPRLDIYQSGVLKGFVRRFENNDTMEFAEACNAFSWDNDDPYEIDVNEILESLTESTEPVPTLQHYNWRQALVIASNTFWLNQVLKTMPLAYESYLMRINSGIPFDQLGITIDHLELSKDIKQNIIQAIIDGRVLNGEPADLNF